MRGWIKDVVFVGLCVLGVATVVLSFALPGDGRAASLEVRADSDETRDLEIVAAAIDDALAVEQRELGVDPAPRAPELALARRASLALTGTIPSLEEIRALERLAEGRRLDAWIDHLLEDPRSADYLAERLARALVGVDQGALILYRRRRFVAWLAAQLAAARPWDAIATDMITGEGLWTQHPEANFVTAAIEPMASVPDEDELARRVSRAFLGVRLDCAQCHDHPFDERWSQRDFRGLASFFAKTDVTLTGLRDSGLSFAIEPAVPFHHDLLPERGSQRARLAAWVTHPDNRAFSRAMANRVWALMFGRALVEPVDDLPIDGATHPALEVLADDFAAHGHDLRRLIRVIAATETFARDSRGGVPRHRRGRTSADLDARVASWAEFPLTRLRPEQVVGAIIQSASLHTIDRDSHAITRLARFIQQREFIERYGDAGEDELVVDGGTIPQRLLLLNGDLVHARTKDDLVNNAATRIHALTADDARAIEVAYLAVLTRRPTPAEATYFAERLDAGSREGRRDAIADLYWALLNSTELAWNH